MTSTNLHRRRVYGLTLESAIALPELLPGGDGAPEARVETGEVPTRLGEGAREGGFYQVEPERVLLWMPGEARFLVSNGEAIRVQPEAGADPAEIRRLLLSSPLGALLRQRGLMVLHASAVAIEGTGVLLLGGPNAGKSTLAARFLDERFRVLSDDIAAVRFDDDGQPWIMAGWAELKLWPDALAALGREPTPLARIRSGSEKRVLGFSDRFDPTAVPLRAIYLLEPGRGTSDALTALEGVARGAALLNHTYHGELIEGTEPRKRLYAQIGRLAAGVRLRRLERPADRFHGRVAVERIVEDCRR
jgi:hypothetical protein